MKFVINGCFGGFGLSKAAIKWLMENKGWKVADHVDPSKLYYNDCKKLLEEGYHFYNYKSSYEPLNGPTFLASTNDLEFRSNPDIVECVEVLGKKADGDFASLEVVEADYPIEQLEIDEYDGNETLQTIPVRF